MKLKRFSTAGPNGRFFQRLNEWAEEVERLFPASDSNSLTTVTTKGTTRTPLHASKPPSQSGGMRFRGEYVSGTAKVFDCFIVRGSALNSPAAGFYICVKDDLDGTHGPPDNSEYFAQLSKNDTIGNWL